MPLNLNLLKLFPPKTGDPQTDKALSDLVINLNRLIERLNVWNTQLKSYGPIFSDANGLVSHERWSQSGPAELTTTDATVTTVITTAIRSGRTYYLESFAIARRTGGSAGTAEDGAAIRARDTYNTVGGVVTKLTDRTGTAPVEYNASNQAAWALTHAISGTDILTRVTGAVNNTIDWQVTTTVRWQD